MISANVLYPSTPFGTVNFFLKIAPDGTVAEWTSPSADQPVALLKLTHGADAERAVSYFQDLGEHLSLEIGVLLGPAVQVPDRAALQSTFAQAFPDPAEPEDPAVRLRREFWAAHPALFPALPNTSRQYEKAVSRLYDLVNRKRKLLWRQPEEVRRALLPQFILLRKVLPPEVQIAPLRAIGALDLPEGDDYLYDQFYAPQKTVDDQEFLRAINESSYPRNAARLREVYQPKRFDTETLELYLRVLNRKRDAENVPVALRILEKRPHLAEEVYPVLRRNDYRERYEVLRGTLAGSHENGLTDNLFGLLRSVAPPALRPTLPDLYAKQATPELTGMPAVTWPQGLFRHHRAASTAATTEEITTLIRENLQHEAARVRYLALLELYLAETEERGILVAHPDIQNLVLESVASRVDKVSASALRLLSKHYDRFSDPQAVVEAVIPLARRARYQAHLYKILRARTQEQGVLARQGEVFRREIESVAKVSGALAIGQILNFLKELPEQEELLELVRHRERLLRAGG